MNLNPVDKTLSIRIENILKTITKNDISRGIFVRLINQHAGDYYNLGIGLGMNMEDLKTIRHDYANDCRMALAEIIFEHFLKNERYTPWHLFDSLRYNDLNRTANWLIDEFEKCINVLKRL